MNSHPTAFVSIPRRSSSSMSPIIHGQLRWVPTAKTIGSSAPTSTASAMRATSADASSFDCESVVRAARLLPSAHTRTTAMAIFASRRRRGMGTFANAVPNPTQRMTPVVEVQMVTKS